MGRDINVNDIIKIIPQLHIPCQKEGCGHVFDINTQDLIEKNIITYKCPLCNNETEINGENCFNDLIKDLKKYGFFI